MNTIDTILSQIGLVPVVVIDDCAHAVPLAKALVAGGIPVAEVTFRTPAAKDAIAAIAQNVPRLLVGAGTVHSLAQAQEAVDAGAQFIITPGFQTQVVAWCLEQNVPVFPGCSTPRDLENALALGLKTVKFFPAEVSGGTKALRAFSGPYADLRFLPTGGVNESNVLDYLALPNVAACGGVWMVPRELVREARFEEITALCRKAVAKVLGFEVLHVGINSENKAAAEATAAAFSSLFSFPVKETPIAYFAGSGVEVMKSQSRGTLGHIAVGTNDISRAVAYFQRRGVALDLDHAFRDEDGKMYLVYLQEELGGFAIHLRSK